MHALNLKNLSLHSLKRELNALASSEQCRQIFRSIQRDGVSRMQDLKVSHRIQERILSWKMPMLEPEVLVSDDQSRKLIFRTPEGSFESVLIPHARRTTVCVSSQMGCALDCSFCVTGLIPLKRNLEAWEIVEQVQWAKRLNKGATPSNVVFMGMGEPLLNFDEAKTAVEILTDANGLGLARSRITVSTAGYIPHIVRWGEEVGTNLAVSIIAATDEKRSALMSINRKFPLDALVETIAAYTKTVGRRVLCEYLLIDGMTDTPEDAQALARRFSEMNVTINLIPYNENSSLPYRRPSRETIEAFKQTLVRLGLFTTVRWSHGGDIGAACGQLSASTKSAT